MTARLSADILTRFRERMTRRHFFERGSHAVGWAALASLLQADGLPSALAAPETVSPATHFPPKAKHVIYLHMVGGPPQMDLYDHKPVMEQWYDKDLPDSVRKGQRLT
ncbi:MAG: sulfatase, partial [Planctomycetota bacterium]